MPVVDQPIIQGGINIRVDKRYSEVVLTVYKPENGGKFAVVDDVKKELQLRNIHFGIDFELIDKIFAEELFDQPFVIANWQKPVDGINGYVNYRHEREKVVKPKEGEDGNVNYYELGLIRNITAGTIIADIIPEVVGENGFDVTGAVIMPYVPHPASPQIGTGTCTSEDGTMIVANIDGNLVWRSNSFIVEETVVIKNNVDVKTGNIDFIGDVVVKGDVLDNFSVISKKDVTISGSATGAKIIAGGKITISQGALNSTLIAENEIRVGFCENSKIDCKANVVSQSFVSCDVRCDGQLLAIIGVGKIVGGKYTSLQSPVANIIGSATYTKTSIVVGNNALLTAEREKLLKQMDVFTEQMTKLAQIVELLTAQKRQGTLPPEREEMLNSSIKARFQFGTNFKMCKKRISEIENELRTSQSFNITVKKTMYPGTSIAINSAHETVSIQNDRCIVTVADDGLLKYSPLR